MTLIIFTLRRETFGTSCGILSVGSKILRVRGQRDDLFDLEKM